MSWQNAISGGLGIAMFTFFYCSFNLNKDKIFQKLFFILGMITTYIQIGVLRSIAVTQDVGIARVLFQFWDGLTGLSLFIAGYISFTFIVDVLNFFTPYLNGKASWRNLMNGKKETKNVWES